MATEGAAGGARLFAVNYRAHPLRWGLSFWGGGVALAFTAQHMLATRVDLGRLLFLAAAIVAVAGMRLIDGAAPQQGAEASQPPAARDWRDRRTILGLGLAAAGLAASVAVVRLVRGDSSVGPTALLWVVSMALAIGGAGLLALPELRTWRPRLTRATMIELALLLGILALAVALRLPRLSAIPPDVHGDEASVGLDARALLHGGWDNLFHVGWAGLPELSYGSVALSMRVFGDDLYGIRMASLLEGLVSVGLVYLVARRLFGARPALLAAFVLAVAQWHIHFSRTGFHYMQALPTALLVVLFVLRALDTKRELDFVLLGLSAGLCMNAYYAGREIFAVLVPYALVRVARERAYFRANAIGLLWALAAFWIFLAPQTVASARSPDPPLLGPRAQGVWLFAPNNIAHERGAYGVSSNAHVLAIQAQRTIEAVNRTGETSLQYGRLGKPLFDVWSAALIVLGAGYAVSRIRQPRYLLLTLWLLVPLLVTTLTIDAPFVPHMMLALPVLAILAAVVVDAGWRGFEAAGGRAGRTAIAALVAVFAALALHANYQDYFGDHVKTRRFAGYFTLLSRYALDVNSDHRVYLVAPRSNLLLGYETVRFLAPHLDGSQLGAVPRLPLRRLPPGKGAAFVVDLGDHALESQTLDALRRAYPVASEALHFDSTGFPEFITYEVSASELARRAHGA